MTDQDVLYVKDFRKAYGDFVAVGGISFAIKQGEIFGLLGPNGAGKTTTLECLEGIRQADRGELNILGVDPRREPRRLRNLIGVQLQTSSLPAEMHADEAMRFFQHVLDTRIDAEQAVALRMAATLGKARCLIETAQQDQAIKLAEAVIAKADAEDADILGRAYLTLGLALKKAGRLQDSQFALLHVDTLYSATRDVHAESLFNLAQVWTELKKPERALEARRTLADQYGDTRWAQPAEK